MTDQANPESRLWRRLQRFSVRGMIVVVLLVGGSLGWFVRSARIQREAVAAIEKAGGGVSYDWERRRRLYLGRTTLGAELARGSVGSQLFRSRDKGRAGLELDQ